MDLYIGIRVWKVNSDDSEAEITAGSAVATVMGPEQTTTLSNTWNCPETISVKAVVIRVYQGSTLLKYGGEFSVGGISAVFITEDLDTVLNAAVWTVYYAFYYSAYFEETYFRFGSSTYNSRIVDFSYGEAPPVGAAKNFIDGLVVFSNS